MVAVAEKNVGESASLCASAAVRLKDRRGSRLELAETVGTGTLPGPAQPATLKCWVCHGRFRCEQVSLLGGRGG